MWLPTILSLRIGAGDIKKDAGKRLSMGQQADTNGIPDMPHFLCRVGGVVGG